MKLTIVCSLTCLILVLQSNHASQDKSQRHQWDIKSWLPDLQDDSEMAESARQLAAPILLGTFLVSPIVTYMGNMLGRAMRMGEPEEASPENAIANEPDGFNSLISNRRPVSLVPVRAGTTSSCPPTSLCTETSTVTDTTTSTSTSTTLSIATETSTTTTTSAVTDTTTTTLTDTSTTTSTSSVTTTLTSSVTSTSSTTLTTTVTTIFNDTVTTVVTVNLLTSTTKTITRTSFTTVTVPFLQRVGVNQILADWNGVVDQLDSEEKAVLQQDLNQLEKYHMARIESSKEVSD